MNKLYVVDASGYLYRSYYAIRNITNSKGESTNALYGFLRSLQKLRKDFNPEYLVCIFDGPKGSQKREAIYSEYKAHRTSTPPDLIYQIKWAQEACALLGIPFLSVPGVEADDTMGTIALWGENHNFHIYLCTSDKDLSQMVNDKVSLLNTFKENLVLGPKEVEETYGVPPSQMIDFLAITGDTSDNIPGLPGFGPKTAIDLLQKHGTLEYILQHPEVVSGKKQEVITQFAPQALLSKQLVTIHTSVEIPTTPEAYAIRPFDLKTLKDFYLSMNFNSLLRELEQQSSENRTDEAATTLTPEEPVSYHLVDDIQELKDLLAKLNKHHKFSVVTKGTTQQPIKAQLIGIALSVSPQEAWYIPANGKLGIETLLNLIKPFLENPSHSFFGHNIKYDTHLLSNYGITLPSITFDTMLASYVLNSHVRQHSLEDLMLNVMGKHKHDLSDAIGKGKKAVALQDLPIEQLMRQACEEADYINRLEPLLSKQLTERNLGPIFSEIELPLMPVLAGMERRGIYVDPIFLEIMSKEILLIIKQVEQDIYALAGEEFNINSPKQMSEILFTKMGIHPPKKTATGLSTNVDVLESLREKYPIAGKILEYRSLEKLRSTYIDTLPLEIYPKTKRIHCTFNQTVAATGRLSCQDPNLQNIPTRTDLGKKIRKAFLPEKQGWSYLAADYSQIELRLLAHLSDDPDLIKAFVHGEDIHVHTAAAIFNVPLANVTPQQRHNAKAVNFGIVYGQQAYGLSQELGIDVKSAASFIEKYFQKYSCVQTFMEKNIANARDSGRATTYTGRERLIPEISSKNNVIRAAAERLAINTPLQGTAADLIKMAMIEIDKQLLQRKMAGYMILQIHDELIFEVPDEEIEPIKKLVQDTMEGVLKLKVPLVVDIIVGKNWAEC